MNANERLTVEFCWCGLEHAIPNNLSRMASEEGREIFCPLGHKWHAKKTETQKLRERVSVLACELNEADALSRSLERKLKKLEKPKAKKKKGKRGKHDKKKGD